MVHHHRYHQLRKPSDEESQNHHVIMDCSTSAYYKRSRPKLLSFLLLITFLSCCYVFAPLFLPPSFTLSLFYSSAAENDQANDVNASPCSSVLSGTICCDRSGYRSDICVMKGDIRTHSSSSSIFLYNSRSSNNVSKGVEGTKGEEDQVLQHEKIKPYTRKWETSVMDTIDELNLISKKVKLRSVQGCDVQHDVPAVFFSNGGYTGNVYHEFNDGIIPLYITSQRFNKKVVFVILEYHNWWIMKYGDILSHLSEFPPIDFTKDNRTHCFPEAIVGLKIHDELAVDPALVEGHKSIVDFRNLLDRAYWPRIKGLIHDEEKEAQEKLREQLSSSPSAETSQQHKYISQGVEESASRKPKLVILSRSGSRAIINENFLVKMAGEIGFEVEVLRPNKRTELAKIYRALNASDVMIGVHGAAMTHFLFLRPGCVFIQVVPLGTNWAAKTYYGEPARKLGLKYVGYEIHPRESSLYEKYDKNDAVLRDPESINKKGWEYTKKIYLDSQNVTLDLRRFRKRLHRAYEYTISKSNLKLQHQPQ